MPAAARKSSRDRVVSITGRGPKCCCPTTTSTNQGSNDTFINSIGAVRIGDQITIHTRPGCTIDASRVTRASTRVFINGRGAARLGDLYTPDNIISSGSRDTIFG